MAKKKLEEEKYAELLANARSKNYTKFEKNHYLFSSYAHYATISNRYEKRGLQLDSDQLFQNIIAAQQARERKAYKLLDVANAQELTDKFLMGLNKQGIQQKALDTITNIKLDPILDSMVNSLFLNADSGELEVINSDQIQKVVQTEFKRATKNVLPNNQTMVKAKEFLGETLVNRIININTDMQQESDLAAIQYKQEFINKVNKINKSAFKGDLLEFILADILQQITASNPNIKIISSGSNQRNIYGKLIKADITMELGKNFVSGISAKNYTVRGSDKASTDFTIHSAQKLTNFHQRVQEAQIISGRGKIMQELRKSFQQLQRANQFFQSDRFIFHLINQVAHVKLSDENVGRYEGKISKNVTNSSEPVNDLINFVKSSLPLFIGSQIKINGDPINVDFMNLNGTFVPISELFQSVLDSKTISDINIYSNAAIDWAEMYKKKINSPGYYYSNTVLNIGHEYGEKVYKEMRLGRMHLKVLNSLFSLK